MLLAKKGGSFLWRTKGEDEDTSSSHATDLNCQLDGNQSKHVIEVK